MGDRRRSLSAASLDQVLVAEAPVVIVLSAVLARTAVEYGDRAWRYVNLEAGHVAQNVLLAAVALGLGAVPVGAFEDESIQETLGLPALHRPLYVIPVGRPA
jgi:SagB-type dehydrogenase family enzyme